jgi:hypothetical protein
MQGQAELAAVRASVGLPDLSDTHALLALPESIAACENRLGTSLKCPRTRLCGPCSLRHDRSPPGDWQGRLT